MITNNIEHLKGKQVVLVLKNGFKYQGELKDLTDDIDNVLIVDDYKLGATTIDVSSISAISEL